MADTDTIVDCVLEPIFSVDADKNITFANNRVSNITQVSRDRIIGSDINFIEQFVSNGFNRLYRSIKSVSAGETDHQQVELEMRHPPSAPVRRQLTAQARVTPLLRDGKRCGAVVVLRDMTVQRQQRERLHVLSRILRHDIRNQLNKILALHKVVDKVEHSQKQWVETALGAANNLYTTAEKHRLIEKKIAGKSKRHPQNLIQIVSEVVAEVREEYPNAAITCAVAESEYVAVTGGFAIAVEEIIVNAIKHNDSPEPQVKITTVENHNSYYIDIKIADNGPGIEPKQAEIIEAPRQVDQSTEHLDGLGLWAVRWVMSNCEGRLRFEANDPRGTVAILSVPRSKELNYVTRDEFEEYDQYQERSGRLSSSSY